MKAKEYKEKFLHMMAEGYTPGDAVVDIMQAFIEEYNTLIQGKQTTGVVVHNALKTQDDKWKAFARSLPNYAIKEDAWLESIKFIKPHLWEAYQGYNSVVSMARNMKEEVRKGL